MLPDPATMRVVVAFLVFTWDLYLGLISRLHRRSSSVSIVRIGATKEYAAQWEKAFGKKTPKKGDAKQEAKKKSTAGKKTAAKKPGKTKKS